MRTLKATGDVGVSPAFSSQSRVSFPRKALALLTVALSLASLHCSTKKRPAPKPVTRPTTLPTAPPIIDTNRGGGSFPLEATTLPTNIGELKAALQAGYAKRLLSPGENPATQPSPITIREAADGLETLRINVSNYRVRPEYEPTQLPPNTPSVGSVHADHVAYTARPLQYAKGKMNVELKADDATLELLQDPKTKQKSLVLAGARSGSLHIHAKRNEMEAIAFAAGDKGASKGGVFVTEVKGSLTSDNPRSLEAFMTIKGLWLLLPLEVTAGGRIDVGDDMIATFSKVGATGRGPGGDIVAPFINKYMVKLNGKTAPLMSFRDGKTQATDFHITVGQDLDLKITFGQPEP